MSDIGDIVVFTIFGLFLFGCCSLCSYVCIQRREEAPDPILLLPIPPQPSAPPSPEYIPLATSFEEEPTAL